MTRAELTAEQIAKMRSRDLDQLLTEDHLTDNELELVLAECEARDHDMTDPSAGAASGHFPS